MVKLNSDGHNGTWAAVIRGNMGEVLAAAKGRSKCKRIDLIELQRLLNVVLLAVNKGFEEVEASTNSLYVKQY